MYDVHDLINVKWQGDGGLRHFYELWTLTVNRLNKSPDEGLLRSILWGHLKKSKALQHDIMLYERLADGDPDKTYSQLLSVLRHQVHREIHETNRDRIVRTQSNMISAPAVGKENSGEKDICFAFRKNGSCKFGDKCKYRHERSHTPSLPASSGTYQPRKSSRDASRSKSPGSRRDRSSSKGRGKGQSNKPDGVCRFFLKGACKYGVKCRYQHNKMSTSVPAVSEVCQDEEATNTAVAYATAAVHEQFLTDTNSDGQIRASLVARSHIGASYVVDTGSGEDLIGDSAMSKHDWEHVRPSNSERRLATANGVVTCDRVLERNVGTINDTAEFLVLPESPSVLSVGKRVMNRGFSFVWWSGTLPRLILPNGKELELALRHNVPILSEEDLGCIASSTQESDECSWKHLVHELSEQLNEFLVPKARSRTNLYTSSDSDVPRSMLLGAYTRRGAGMTHATKKHAGMVALIHRLAAHRPEAARHEPYLSIQVNSYNSLRTHVDQYNDGETWIISLGDFTGGRLWIADGDKDSVPSPHPTEDTQGILGRYVNVKERWFKFNPKHPHAVEDSCGERFSIALFSPMRAARHLTKQHVDDLRDSGFNVEDLLERMHSERIDACPADSQH
eukprot:43868-Amphidinium_carterae.2